jgi:hypothetical protein
MQAVRREEVEVEDDALELRRGVRKYREEDEETQQKRRRPFRWSETKQNCFALRLDLLVENRGADISRRGPTSQ